MICTQFLPLLGMFQLHRQPRIFVVDQILLWMLSGSDRRQNNCPGVDSKSRALMPRWAVKKKREAWNGDQSTNHHYTCHVGFLKPNTQIGTLIAEN
jgi:hypothetical protein